MLLLQLLLLKIIVGIRCLAFLAIACCSLDRWTNVCLLVVLPILEEVGVCVYVQSMLSSFGAFGWSVVLVSLRRFFGPFLVNVRCALVFLGPIFVYWIKWFWKNYRVKKFMSMSNPRATSKSVMCLIHFIHTPRYHGYSRFFYKNDFVLGLAIIFELCNWMSGSITE